MDPQAAKQFMPWDDELVEVTTSAALRFFTELETAAPFTGCDVRAWVESLYSPVPFVDAFRLPGAFPMLLLPWELEKSIRGNPDQSFQTALALAAMYGYHHVRALDDLMDGDAEFPLNLLPVIGCFQTQAVAALLPYFPNDHGFWHSLRNAWTRCADLTARDAQLQSLDLDLFKNVAAQKTAAGKILIEAVCVRYDRPDLYASWSRFHDTIGCCHQMFNDMLDWHKDSLHQNQTYILSESTRRRHIHESDLDWLLREGFVWSMDKVSAWTDQLRIEATGLGSESLAAYIEAVAEARKERATAYLRAISSVGEFVAELRRSLA